jgi:hypothetical protein
MGLPHASVTCSVTVYVSVPEEPPVPLTAELHYDMSDPYAVRLSLGAPAMRPATWVFGRALLADGMHRPTGVGDVLVIPGHRCRPDSVRIVLRSAAGAALVELPASEIAAFLRQTFRKVPSGTESLHVDVDRALAELTGRGG